jgi:hypothetical protein
LSDKERYAEKWTDGEGIRAAAAGWEKWVFIVRLFSGSFAVFMPEEGGQMAQDLQLLSFFPGRKKSRLG